MSKRRAWMSWSSGKDSAFALGEAQKRGDLEIVALLTTINETHARVAMHAVRESLLEAQALAANLPLIKVPIPSPCSNEIYEARMTAAMQRARDEGVMDVVFGDLFLEDIRAYREKNLAEVGMTPHFPLWERVNDRGRDTAELARDMIASGLEAVLTCVDPKQLDPRFVGRTFDAKLLAELPPSVDPCGERGEFHSFTFACEAFGDRRIAIVVGEIVTRDGFVFADVLQA